MKKLMLGSLFAATLSFAQPKIEVKDAWVREVPPTSNMSAAYMIIENKGKEPDKLIDAASNASKIVEVHETVEGRMRRVKALEVPAGGKVELKPGGYHMMLINLNKPLKEGDNVEITLKFEKIWRDKGASPCKERHGWAYAS